jgi:prophage regulatory protein
MPILMGASEIRSRLGGISRQRVSQLTQAEDFPKPYARLTQGSIWRAEDVENWIREYRPTLGGEQTLDPDEPASRPDAS